jgi:biopolymer transport protein ExbD
MMSDGILKQKAIISALETQSLLKPKGGVHKRNITADLLLTALIDAFSILVIFLLMSFSSTGEIMYIGKGMELPHASKVEQLDRNPIIKVESDKVYLEDKEYNKDSIFAALLELRKKDATEIATIQADRRIQYEALNWVVLALSQAGFSDIRFAVLTK